jgi:hypothetical protein
VTSAGGSNDAVCGGIGGCGTIFRFTPPSTFTTLFEFDGGTFQGGFPLGILHGTDGNFYGTAGDNIFRFKLGGQFTVLQTIPDIGFLPTSAQNQLIQAGNGTLYGALSTYSLSQLQFYEINPSGQGFLEFASLGNGLGANGVPSLMQASDGNLWDEVPNLDSVITVSPTTGQILKSFEFDGANGGFPDASIIQGSDGRLFGTATEGGVVAAGQQASGTVWVLDAGLPAPASVVGGFTPASGVVGSKVRIRGSHFVGTTAVTFNGVNATFKVLNTNFISATVPAGATTGPIAVTNPGGTAISVGHFTVQ